MNGIIIGFGNMGKLHYSKLKSKGINIPIIVDANINSLDINSKIFKNVEDIPSFENIDFIFICTPTNTHFEILNKIMEKNIPIFLEKPAVRTLEEINHLRKNSENFIFVGEVELFNDNFKKLLDFKGTPSKIDIQRKVNLDYFLKGSKPWFLDENLSGGIVLDLMIHDITLLILKFGIPTIKSVEFSRNKFEINDFVKVILSFDKFEAEITSSWIENDDKIPIKVILDIYNGAVEHIVSDNYMKTKDKDSFDSQLDVFLNAIKENKLPYNLNLFLDATKLCLDINKIINAK
jgi:predicted dehydrogenase